MGERFILTMRNVNDKYGSLVKNQMLSFILTMRNVNSGQVTLENIVSGGFILTMRNVNIDSTRGIANGASVLY